MLKVRGNVAVSDTLLVVEGFWFPKNAVEGYVLRCADSWGNAEWGPPNIIDTHNESAIVGIGSSVTQYDNAEVTLTVPGPGYIVVTSNVWIHLSHTEGTTDKVYLSNSPSPTALGGWNSTTTWEIPSSWPTDSQIGRTFCVTSTFDVDLAGTYSYYLVGQMYYGVNVGDRFWFAQMTGIYYPHPIPVAAASAEDAEFLRKKEEFENR